MNSNSPRTYGSGISSTNARRRNFGWVKSVGRGIKSVPTAGGYTTQSRRATGKARLGVGVQPAPRDAPAAAKLGVHQVALFHHRVDHGPRDAEELGRLGN